MNCAPSAGTQLKPQNSPLPLDFMYCPTCGINRWHRALPALAGQPLATCTPEGWRSLRFGEWMQRALTRNCAAQCGQCGSWRLRILPSTMCP
jgi:hypothetical protein